MCCTSGWDDELSGERKRRCFFFFAVCIVLNVDVSDGGEAHFFFLVRFDFCFTFSSLGYSLFSTFQYGCSNNYWTYWKLCTFFHHTVFLLDIYLRRLCLCVAVVVVWESAVSIRLSLLLHNSVCWLWIWGTYFLLWMVYHCFASSSETCSMNVCADISRRCQQIVFYSRMDKLLQRLADYTFYLIHESPKIAGYSA